MAITVTDLQGAKPRFTQWETDRVLTVSGTTAQPVLRFANGELKRALVVVAEETETEGTWTCKVPNFVLQFEGPLFVSVIEDGDEDREIFAAAYNVLPRLQPQDYAYEENIGYVNWVRKAAEAQAFLDDVHDWQSDFDAARDEAIIDAETAIAIAKGQATGEISTAAQAAAASLTQDVGAAVTAGLGEIDDAKDAALGLIASAGGSVVDQAQQYANEASDSADASAGSAVRAEDEADAAEGSATAAAASAAAAAESATDAETAQTGAETAQGAAEDAQEAAEAAQAAAEAVLESIPEDYTELSTDVGKLKTDVAYTDDCIAACAIPYATDGTVSTQSGPKSFTQAGSTVTINGTSNATAGQGSTRLQACGTVAMWTASTTPASAQIYPITLRAGRTYRLSVRVLSGTRDKGTGSGNLTTRFVGSDESNVAQCVLGINDSYASVDHTPTVDTQVTIRHMWGRLMVCTNLRIEVLFRDVTDEVGIAGLGADVEEKQDRTYGSAMDWAETFGTETDVYGWQNGYYNAEGKSGESTSHRCIRTNNKQYFVAPEGIEKIVFTAPTGFHARITEYNAAGTFIQNVGNYSSGSNAAEIVPTAGYKYAFCFGEYDAYPEITEQLVATITATLRRSVESRDEEQDARLTALERGEQDLPDYWAAYLPARIDAVTAIQKTIGAVNDAFLLVSDYHIRTNRGNSLAVLKRVARQTGIRKIYFAGDAGGSTGTSAEARSHAFQKSVGVWNDLAGCADEFFGVLGNHEWINDNVFGNGAVFQGYLRRYTRASDGMGAGNSYYIDDPVCRIRTYFINDSYGSAPRGFNWMGQTMEAMENDWWVLVVTHNGFIPGAASEAEYDGVVIDDSAPSNQGARIINLILGGFNGHTAVSTRYGGVDYSWDFSGHTGGGVIGIFSGHYHHGTLFERDDELNTFGVPVFRAGTDSMQAAKVAMPTEEGKVPWYWEDGVIGGTKIAREAGTTDEHCVYAVQIDMAEKKCYITAFGGDHDWEFDFGPAEASTADSEE